MDRLWQVDRSTTRGKKDTSSYCNRLRVSQPRRTACSTRKPARSKESGALLGGFAEAARFRGTAHRARSATPLNSTRRRSPQLGANDDSVLPRKRSRCRHRRAVRRRFSRKDSHRASPFIEYKKAHPELAPQLQEQADRALRHFCYEADLKWVSLLLWAGANARSRGPTLDERWADDPECHTTALREACSKGNLDILKRLKPDPAVDNLAELLSSAALATSKELIEYLVGLGANPNDKENGGSSALDHCLWHLGFANMHAFVNKHAVTRYDVSETFECMKVLLSHGGLWRPEPRNGLTSLRQTLYKCEPGVTVDLVRLLARHKAVPEETLEQLLDAPRMKQHLSTLGMKLFGSPSKQLKPRV
jgi:hypothetical protein